MDWKAFLLDFTSRKFLLVIAATVAMFMHLIDGIVWAGIVGAYLGLNVLQKKVENY